jgi:ribosome maturation factor RimP
MDNNLLEKLLKDCDVNLYDTQSVTENGRKIFRIYITSENGVNLEKCTQVTKILSPILDLDPPIKGEYFLEVSSPGIERKLTKPMHFQKSLGLLLKLKLSDAQKIKCKLLKADDKEITIEDKSNNEEKKIKYIDISKAKTYFEW